MKKRDAAIFLILVLLGAASSCRRERSERVGGQCLYESEPVTISVRKIEKEKLSGDTEILVISYEMTFDGGRKKGSVESGSVEVKPEEAAAKAVETGKTFHAAVSRLVSGTCNPEPSYPDLKDWN